MAVGQSILTDGGLAAFAKTAGGGSVTPKYYKVTDQPLPLDPATTSIEGWRTAPISAYLPIDRDTIEFVLDIPPEEATNYSTTFGLFLEDHTLFMLAAPPYPLPPLLRQTMKIQLVYMNSENIIDFKYIPFDETAQDLSRLEHYASDSNINIELLQENSRLKAACLNNRKEIEKLKREIVKTEYFSLTDREMATETVEQYNGVTLKSEGYQRAALKADLLPTFPVKIISSYRNSICKIKKDSFIYLYNIERQVKLIYHNLATGKRDIISINGDSSSIMQIRHTGSNGFLIVEVPDDLMAAPSQFTEGRIENDRIVLDPPIIEPYDANSFEVGTLYDPIEKTVITVVTTAASINYLRVGKIETGAINWQPLIQAWTGEITGVVEGFIRAGKIILTYKGFSGNLVKTHLKVGKLAEGAVTWELEKSFDGYSIIDKINPIDKDSFTLNLMIANSPPILQIYRQREDRSYVVIDIPPTPPLTEKTQGILYLREGLFIHIQDTHYHPFTIENEQINYLGESRQYTDRLLQRVYGLETVADRYAVVLVREDQVDEMTPLVIELPHLSGVAMRRAETGGSLPVTMKGALNYDRERDTGIPLVWNILTGTTYPFDAERLKPEERLIGHYIKPKTIYLN